MGGGALRRLPPVAWHAPPLPSRRPCLVDSRAAKAWMVVCASASYQPTMATDLRLDPALLTDAACAAPNRRRRGARGGGATRAARLTSKR